MNGTAGYKHQQQMSIIQPTDNKEVKLLPLFFISLDFPWKVSHFEERCCEFKKHIYLF